MASDTTPCMSRLLRKTDGSASTLALNKPSRVHYHFMFRCFDSFAFSVLMSSGSFLR